MVSLTKESGIVIEQNKVLRNTYALLGLSMLPTVLGALIGIQMDLSVVQQHPVLFSLGFLVGMFAMVQLIVVNRNNSLGIWLLLGLTFFLGFMLAPILQIALSLRNGGQLVGLAATGTGIIFLTLAGIASSPARNFDSLGKFLFVGFILIFIASIANMFLHLPLMQLVISGVAVLIFSGYILYDVNRIVRGGETNYVLATLSIYMNIYNLFVNLLTLLISLFGQRD